MTMTETNPTTREAAASSYLPSDSELQHIATPGGGWSPRVQAMAAEILRMRAQCPPTAEVEKLREGAREANARHLHISNIGDALREAGQPRRHHGDELERIRDLAGDRDAWKHKADTLGGDLNRIRSLVPTASDEQTTFDAVHAELGRQARDEWRAAADERAKLLDRLHAILFCTFPAEPTMEKQAEMLVAAAKHGAPPAVGDCLMLAHKPGEWSQEADEFFVYRRVSRTPWVQVFWRHGPGIRNSDNNDHMAIDTFLRRCGVDMSKAEGLPGVHWVRAAADCIKGAGIEAQTAIAAMRDVGPELAKAGIQVGPRCSHAEAVAQLRGERDRWREKCEAAHQLADEAARFEGAVVADLATHGFFAAGGLGGVLSAVGKGLAELQRLRKESKRDRAEKQQALLDEIARLFPGKGPLLDRVRMAAAVADKAMMDAIRKAGVGKSWGSMLPLLERRSSHGDFLEAMRKTEPKPEVARKPVRDLVEEALRMVRGKQQPKVAAAVGQPRAEAPAGATLVDGAGVRIPLVETDGSGTMVDLGETFRKAMEHADPDFFGSQQFLDGKTDEQSRHAHLHDAVAELAKAVERIGGG